MSQDVHKIDVLVPSASSVGLSVFGVLIGLFFIVIPRLGGDAILGLLFGNESSDALVNASKVTYGTAITDFLGNDLLGRAVVFGLWAFVGLCTFVLITSVMGIFTTIEEQKNELGYIHQNKDSILRNDLIFVGYRLGIAALWAIFIIICVRFVMAYFAITGFVALGGSAKLIDWVVFVAAAVVFGISIHLQVVFARLLLGRTRIWLS